MRQLLRAKTLAGRRGSGAREWMDAVCSQGVLDTRYSFHRHRAGRAAVSARRYRRLRAARWDADMGYGSALTCASGRRSAPRSGARAAYVAGSRVAVHCAGSGTRDGCADVGRRRAVRTARPDREQVGRDAEVDYVAGDAPGLLRRCAGSHRLRGAVAGQALDLDRDSTRRSTRFLQPGVDARRGAAGTRHAQRLL